MRTTRAGQSALLLLDAVGVQIFAGGPHDMADARAAITAAGDRLDLPLATTVAQRFGRDVAVTLGKIVVENSVKK